MPRPRIIRKSRREFLAGCLPVALAAKLGSVRLKREEATPRAAALTTLYVHNSHADLIIGRFMEGYTLDGRGEFPVTKPASLYIDQRPGNDKGASVAKRLNVPVNPTIAQALTLGEGRLAVNGVVLVAEHGVYPKSPTGSTVYPKRRFFEQIVGVFRESGRVVPVFIDKHLADNWTDIEWIARTARELAIPLLAGSVLPVSRRDPPVDVGKDQEIDHVIVLSYHTLDGYGFHALEILQCLAEQRRGGETGVRRVSCLTGDAVWRALKAEGFDSELLAEAFERSPDRRCALADLSKKVPEPVLWSIIYRDGLKATVLTLNSVVGAWSAAWRDREGRIRGCGFDTREVRPLMHFASQVRAIDRMIVTGKPSWPIERTILSSGMLDVLLNSKLAGGETIETPNLAIAYRSPWRWRQPPPYPPPRPLDGP